jgi:hypothetical protein
LIFGIEFEIFRLRFSMGGEDPIFKVFSLQTLTGEFAPNATAKMSNVRDLRFEPCRALMLKINS